MTVQLEMHPLIIMRYPFGIKISSNAEEEEIG